MTDLLAEARQAERLIERAGELADAAFHNQIDDDVALARKLGIPEPAIRAEVRRVLFAYSEEAERIRQRSLSNLHRDLYRLFKQRQLARYTLCADCYTIGRVRLASELRHLVVHGGCIEKMFNPLLVVSACPDHLYGPRHRERHRVDVPTMDHGPVP